MSPQHTRSRTTVAGRLMLPIGAWVLSSLIACSSPPQKSAAIALENEARQGEVSGALVEPALAERYPAKAGVRYEQPVAYPENPLPLYPDALLAAQLPPVRMKVRLVIDAQGQVGKAIPLSDVADEHQLFLAGVRDAVQRWKFLPLVQITEGAGETSITVRGSTAVYAGTAIALPFHQDYVFDFHQLDGKPSVTAE